MDDNSCGSQTLPPSDAASFPAFSKSPQQPHVAVNMLETDLTDPQSQDSVDDEEVTHEFDVCFGMVSTMTWPMPF